VRWGEFRGMVMHRRKNFIGFAVGLGLASLLASPHALAAGALALGSNANGVWYGLNANAGSIDEAAGTAMAGCERHGPCRVAKTFWNTCYAFAVQGQGSPHWGWATRGGPHAARRAALGACETHGRPCSIASSGCDRTGR
jgi:hypothetical protein